MVTGPFELGGDDRPVTLRAAVAFHAGLRAADTDKLVVVLVAFATVNLTCGRTNGTFSVMALV
jgi:hypothetical protein